MTGEPGEWQDRTALLGGPEFMEKLASAHVLIAGLGGVGGYVAETLCRAGVGELTIVDNDTVHSTNRNRQLIALSSTEGQYKTDLFRTRLLDINPDLKLHTVQEFIQEDRIDEILETVFDYVADAIDTLSPKVSLIAKTLNKSYPLISSMGSGGKFDPLQVTVSDISETHNCRLAYYIRKQLHRLGIRSGFRVVYSAETVEKSAVRTVEGEKNKRSVVGTISYMPPVFGMVMASVIIRELTEQFRT